MFENSTPCDLNYNLHGWHSPGLATIWTIMGLAPVLIFIMLGNCLSPLVFVFTVSCVPLLVLG